jgi:hypothetical protein
MDALELAVTCASARAGLRIEIEEGGLLKNGQAMQIELA